MKNNNTCNKDRGIPWPMTPCRTRENEKKAVKAVWLLNVDLDKMDGCSSCDH